MNEAQMQKAMTEIAAALPSDLSTAKLTKAFGPIQHRDIFSFQLGVHAGMTRMRESFVEALQQQEGV